MNMGRSFLGRLLEENWNFLESLSGKVVFNFENGFQNRNYGIVKVRSLFQKPHLKLAL